MESYDEAIPIFYFSAKARRFLSRIARTLPYYNWCHESLLDIPTSRCRLGFYQIRFSSTWARSTRLAADSARFFSSRLRRQSLEISDIRRNHHLRRTRRNEGTLENEEVLAALGFPLEPEQMLQDSPAVLAPMTPGGLVPLRIQLDLR